MKIQTEVIISSAHKLPNYPFECKNIHGHNWKVEVIIEGLTGEYDMVCDFKKIKEVLKKYDHVYLNDLIENPTAENLAYKFSKEIYELGKYSNSRYNRFEYVTVRVYESEKSFANRESDLSNESNENLSSKPLEFFEEKAINNIKKKITVDEINDMIIDLETKNIWEELK